ncbi:DNA repair protein RadC [Paramagnetospirillum magnetotacticum MS-1]|uniref:DNA repair protein RadC n=1 Tax=Paramagnetospirillum magnetotacticum MS-1 TaxID=272627 RepID=A0A0C2V0A7_PARME|nr:DNA repair protein RadC [Paramagnetospirillum magnetotacticum]KIL98531.1 DNA repair protein RadC [Paramagnetospirillum magnetotacticum MS-1]
MTKLAGASPSTGQTAEHKGHRERLRSRFLDAPEALPDYELLELLLGAAIPQRDTKPLAKALIKRFGSFADVITADVEDLKTIDGIKDVAAAVLKVVREAAIRLARAPVLNNSVISSWDVLLDYCRTAMNTLPTEQFRLLFLDRKNTLIADEVQQTGTVDHTPLYPREVVKRALALHASAIVMVHNHPSGDPKPSRADMEMTRAVKDALAAVGIALHDHVVVGRKGHSSFKAMGLL